MPDRPNVLLFLCDQLRRDALGCYGDPNVSTPQLDRLADDGVRFANAYSSYPVCVPARFTLMTGEYAHTRNVPAVDYCLSPAERTLADAFTDAGYQTAYFGKWHLTGYERFRFGDDHNARLGDRTAIPEPLRGGFQHWRGFDGSGHHFDTAYFSDDDPVPRTLEGYQTDGLVDLAIEFLDERDNRPFFAVISVEPPHPPLMAPEPYEARWRDREVTFRPNVDLEAEYLARDRHDYELTTDPEALRRDLRMYYAMIENIDDNVGRLREALADRALLTETAIAFTSDHGEMLGSHGLRSKQHPHEESAGIPLILSHPGGNLESGSVIDEPTCSEDWYPTLLGLAGISEDGPGVDLTTLATGAVDHLDRDGILLERVKASRPHHAYPGEAWRGFRTQRYKYTVKGGPEGGSPWQLFDLEADPYEQHNLLTTGEAEATARELHGHLRETLDRTDDGYRLNPAFGLPGLNLPSESEY